ncbi:TolB family protein [Streptomyces hesseae]|uniref:Uncharacterized protein n=1 Tax=Streptomyces hesseae TaxID=3075519 RepID=A0ABU2SKH2_9ACTN|nr:hypothetical protein [Streptomyces sp. DSM 40473]MDT0449487.1 hypothetical protein [Streptomyces sp. DSM 40473]
MVDVAAAVAPAISPDGRLVAHGVVANGGRGGRPHGSVWVTAADGSTAPRRLTDGTARDLGPKWAPDSASLFFTSDREEQGTAQLQRIRLDGSEDIAKAEALTRWRGRISDHWTLLDGRTVALLAKDEPTVEGQRREAERDDAKIWGQHLPATRLRLLDLETGAVRTVDGLGDRHVVGLAQRPDGGPLAVLSWSTPELDPGVRTAELHLVDPGSAAVHDLGPVGIEARSPAWWNHNSVWHLAHLAVTPAHFVGGLAVIDTVPPETGPAVEHRNLTVGMSVSPTELVQVEDGPHSRCSPTGWTPRCTSSTPSPCGSTSCPPPPARSPGSPRVAPGEPSPCWRAPRTSPRTSMRDPRAGHCSGSATPRPNCAGSAGASRNVSATRLPIDSSWTAC